MKSYRMGALRAAVVAMALGAAAIGVPAASAHGTANCDGELELVGATLDGACTMPFQGFPIGVAGVYTANEFGRPEADIHVEIQAKVAFAPQRPIGIECLQTEDNVSRCTYEYNPAPNPLDGPEPFPVEILSLSCLAHTHSPLSTLHLPTGAFACWSGPGGRNDLEAEGWFRDNGFTARDFPEAPGALKPLAGSGLTSVVTTVPFNTYAPDTLLVSRSLGLTYLNLDTATHDVVALDAKRPDGSAAWCQNFEDPENPGSQDCPLFWTPLIPGGGTQTPVLGLQDAKVGSTYAYYCSIHPYMRGTIEVVE